MLLESLGPMDVESKSLNGLGLALLKRVSKVLHISQLVAANTVQNLQFRLKALQLRQGTSSLDL